MNIGPCSQFKNESYYRSIHLALEKAVLKLTCWACMQNPDLPYPILAADCNAQRMHSAAA